jgi:pimeloyl-ACP methyl ester carboxylesterase
MSPPRLWYEEAGDPVAPLLVLVHGSMDRSAGLLRLSRRLAARRRVLRYDRRGYGRSAPHPGPFTMRDQVDDLASLVTDRPALIVGHSYGGNVALALAERHPELVRGAVVYESPLSWFDWWPGTTAGGAALATQGAPEDAAERFMRRLVGDEKWERLPPSTRATRRAEGVAMVGELTDLREHAAWNAGAISCEVLALYGEDGAEHHRRGIEFLGDRLPRCRVAEIAGARHFGPNTHADDVAREILDFDGG